MLHAPKGPWLYFTVINKNGKTEFSTTFAQQLEGELRWQEERYRMNVASRRRRFTRRALALAATSRGGASNGGTQGRLDARRTFVGATRANFADCSVNDFDALSVTSPLKHAAFVLCDEVSDVARRTESVNSLRVIDEKMHGAAPTATALFTDSSSSSGRRWRMPTCVVLGAGGAASAIVDALVRYDAARASSFTDVARRRSRPSPGATPTSHASSLVYRPVDLIVNTVPGRRAKRGGGGAPRGAPRHHRGRHHLRPPRRRSGATLQRRRVSHHERSGHAGVSGGAADAVVVGRRDRGRATCWRCSRDRHAERADDRSCAAKDRMDYGLLVGLDRARRDRGRHESTARRVRQLINAGENPHYYFERQALLRRARHGAMYIVSRIDYRRFEIAATPLYVFSLFALWRASSSIGKTRWARSAGTAWAAIQIQPSEFAVLVLDPRDRHVLCATHRGPHHVRRHAAALDGRRPAGAHREAARPRDVGHHRLDRVGDDGDRGRAAAVHDAAGGDWFGRASRRRLPRPVGEVPG